MQIETYFRAIKSSGFNLEKMHLQDPERIEKLILLVMIAFVWCYKIGIYLNQFVKPIQIKKHERKAKSIFKYGLSNLVSILLNVECHGDIGLENFLSCT